MDAPRIRWEASQTARPSQFAGEVAFPLRDVMDTTASGSGHQVTCIARNDATLDDLNRFFRTIWFLGTSTVLQLPAPLPTILRAWIAAAAGDGGLRASLEQLAALL